MVESDEGKLFIGGLAWETTEEILRTHFSQFGKLTHVQIMRDKLTGRPRGFAFVVFSDQKALKKVLRGTHHIHNRTLDVKRALSREEQQTSSRSGSGSGSVSSAINGNFKTKKIFVGGLPSSISEVGFREYFESYGQVTDVVVMYDQVTRRPRGFGFITFSSEDAVDKVLQKTFHELNGKLVEVKPAIPKDASNQNGGYQGYGGNSSRGDGRIGTPQFMQPQNSTGGGLIPFPGYGALGFGAANSFGYTGYGGYGFGNAVTGFGGPVGAYGNPNGPSTGVIVWGPGAFSNNWGSHLPFGFGASVYGPGPGTLAAPIGQFPSGGGGSGYRKPDNGYANYGVSSNNPQSRGHGVHSGTPGNI